MYYSTSIQDLIPLKAQFKVLLYCLAFKMYKKNPNSRQEAEPQRFKIQ